MLNVEVEFLARLLRIREVPGFSVGQKTTVLSEDSRGFPQFLKADIGMTSTIRKPYLPSTYFPVI
jgi:hypothetical protein